MNTTSSLHSLCFPQRFNFICVVWRVNLIFSSAAALLERACVHRDVSRQPGKLLRWLQGVSSLAARLCGLGKGSSVAAASAGNRPGSVRDGRHNLSHRGDKAGEGPGRILLLQSWSAFTPRSGQKGWLRC